MSLLLGFEKHTWKWGWGGEGLGMGVGVGGGWILMGWGWGGGGGGGGWGGQGHLPGAVLGHCLLQIGLWLHFVRQSVEYQPVATWHPKQWIKTHLECSAPAQSPVCIQRLMDPHWSNIKKLRLSRHCYLNSRACMDNHGQHAVPGALNLIETQGICIRSQAKWKRRHDPTLDMSHWSQDRSSYGICWDQCWFGLPLGETQLSTSVTWIQPKETQPHWRSQQKVACVGRIRIM